MDSVFYAVAEDVKSQIKIKRSIFIATLHFAETIDDAKLFISKIAKEHKTANHNCWAYIVGKDASTFHYSDASEPSGTAGKPIYNTLTKHSITNVVCVVTRYFGGTKLGIRGLIDAYSQVTEEAIKIAKLSQIREKIGWQLITSYSFFETLKYKCLTSNAVITKVDYSDKVKLSCEANKPEAVVLDNYLKEMELQKRINIVLKEEI